MTASSTENIESNEQVRGPRFFGKYKGKVLYNVDPKHLGRIIAIVPSISQMNPTSWASPCSPYAGLGVGLFCVPPVGANVWIEFEEGHLELPIWTGGFWDEKDLASIIPNPFLKPGEFTVATIYGKITLSDVPPSVTLETRDKKTISLSPTGVEIGLPGADISIMPGIIDITAAANVSIKARTGSVSINSPT